MDFTYTIKRMRRKSLKLFVDDNAQVIVYAPMFVKKEEIERFVEKHQDWIAEHIDDVIKANNASEKNITSVRFIGDDIPVVKGNVLTATLDKKGVLVVPDVSVTKERRLILDWYKRQAEAILPLRVEHYSKIIGAVPSSVRISNAKKRWGSCSSDGHVAFTWRLIAASKEEIDYVVIHELCHLKNLNHSKLFWQDVMDYCPDFREREKRLNDTSTYMKLNGWNK